MIQLKVYDSPAKTSQFWMDLYETEPIKLTLSIEDITSADATSTYSKTFKVPGTRKNAEFFKNSFDVDGVLFDVTIKKPAEILVDGAEFKQGQVRLQRVYLNIELDRYDYELIFLGETRDFSSKIGDRGLCELQLSDLIGGVRVDPLVPTTMTADDVVQSWQAYPQNTSLTAGLHNGNIIYPLIDHGNTYDDMGDAEQSRISLVDTNRFTQASHPLTLDRFKPMIRAKRIWDQIFADAGYTYTSDFINSDLFHQMYVSAFGNTATVGWDSTASSVNSNNVAYALNDPSDYYGIGPIFLPWNTVDPGANLYDANFSLAGSTYNGQAYTYYEVPAPGAYEIVGECFYTGQIENSDYSPIPIFMNLHLVGFPAGGGAPTYWASSNTGYNTTLQFNTTLTTGQAGTDINGNPSTFGVGDQLFLVLGDINGEYVDQLYTTDFQFQIVAAPGEYNPVSSLECTYKQIDFIKDILTAFRLVLSPDPNNIQNFIVEPWQEYINSGELYDWSKKLVENKEIVIEPVFYNQSAEIDFKFQLGGDYANIYHQQAYEEPYGWLQFTSNNDLLIGKREIKLTGIAPSILTNIEGGTPADNFNILQLHTHSSEDTGLEHLPIKPKTRLLFYNGLKSVGTHHWYLNGATVEERTTYPLVSPYQEWPIQPQTLNLNWANDVQYWGIAPGLNQSGSTLYSNYWSRYISFLYGKFSRRVTAYFVLNNIDLNTFSFDDTIFVNGTYYRPEKIIDVEIGAYTEVKVQLLTANDYRPAVIPAQELLEVSAVGAANTCHGLPGTITVTTNGTPGFTWQLSNGQTGAALTGSAPGQAPYTFTISNVSAGNYTLFLQDSLGRTKEITVSVPASLATPVVATQIVTAASACNVCDGAITVNPSGGTGPYTIVWSDSLSTSFTRTGLCVGTYSYTVYDSLGCAWQSYVADITCESAPGEVWQFFRSSQDCQAIFNETQNVFYPTGTQPTFNHYYNLSTLSGGSIKGCWTPTNITTDAATALEVAEFNTCQECNGIVPSGDVYLMEHCNNGTFKNVPAVPGIAVGQVYELVGIKGCFVVQSISENAADATIATGPYTTCLECGTFSSTQVESCTQPGVYRYIQYPSPFPTGTVVRDATPGFEDCYIITGVGSNEWPNLSWNADFPSCEACASAEGKDFLIEECVTGNYYNAPKTYTFNLGDVVEFTIDANPSEVKCGTIISIVDPLGMTDATLHSPVTRECGDTLHCDVPNTQICVTNFGASMVPCIGGTLDDYMEGWVDLSMPTPVDATFRLVVGWLEGTGGNCNNVQNIQDLYVTVSAGDSYGLLTCNNGAPFISSSGATICSVTLVESDYPEC